MGTSATSDRRCLAWWLPRVGWWTTVATCAAVVVGFLSGGTRPFDLTKATVLLIGVSVAGACAIAWRVVSGDRVPWPRVAPAVAAYLFVVALASATSLVPAVSVLGRFGRQTGLVTTVAVIALAWLVIVFTWRRPERLQELLVVLVVCFAVHAVYVLFQQAEWDLSSWSRRNSPVPIGTAGNSNFAGAYLAIGLPLLIWLRNRADDRRLRRAAIVLVAVFVLALWFTASRGAIIATLVGVAVTGWADRDLVPRWLTRMAAAAAIAAYVVVVIVAFTPATSDGLRTDNVFDAWTLQSRAGIWESAITVVGERPLLGVGPDAFGFAFPPAAPADMVGRPFPVDKAHNLFLERATETGLLGMAAYVAVLGISVAAIVRARRTLTGDRLALLAASSGALAAYIGQSLVSIDAIPLAVLGWVLLAATLVLADPWLARARAASAGEPADADADADPDSGADPDAGAGAWSVPERRTPAWLVVVLGAGVTVVTVAALIPWTADRSLHAAQNEFAAARRRPATLAQVVPAYDTAIDRYPLEPRARGDAARAMLDLLHNERVPAEAKPALAEYGQRRATESLEQTPGDVDTWLVDARIRTWRAIEGADEWAAADEELAAIEAFDPYNPLPHVYHGVLLSSWLEQAPPSERAEREALEARARQVVDRGRELTDPHRDLALWLDTARSYERLGALDDAIAAATVAAAIERKPGPAARYLADLQQARDAARAAG